MATGTVDNSGTLSGDYHGFWAMSSIDSFTNRDTGRIEGGAPFSGPSNSIVNAGLACAGGGRMAGEKNAADSWPQK